MFYKGFYEDYFSILEATADEDKDTINFEFLENITDVFENEKLANIDLERFLHGICDEFAMVLSKRYGYQIKLVFTKDYFIHAYCQKDDYLIDVRGVTDDEKLFFSEFDMRDTYTITCDTAEEAYRKIEEFFDAKNESFVIEIPEQLNLIMQDKYLDYYYKI